MASQVWSTMRRRGGRFLENLNQTVEGASSEFLELGDSFLEGSRGGLNDEIGPEEGYKAALIQFQLDQVKLTKEYQKVIGEKDAELGRVRALYTAETGKVLDGGVEKNADASGEKEMMGSTMDFGTFVGGRGDPMAAFVGMSAEQLLAQVEVLLDSVTSWEARVAELVESKANYAAQAAQMRLQAERSELRLGDLVDRVKLQQTEMEKYILMAEEGRMRTLKDRETIEGLVKDYTTLVSESQAAEAEHTSMIDELENKRDELQVKVKAYERNIIQLIDTQAEIGLKQGEVKPSSSTTPSFSAVAPAVEQLQKKVEAQEEEIKRLLLASSAPAAPPTPQSGGPDATTLLARAEAAEAEIERLKKELERTKKTLEQATKAGEKLGKDHAMLRAQREEEERAEAALREEVTELQAKLEAAYKGSKAELALVQDKLVKMEGALIREVEKARAVASEEAMQRYQKVVEVANQEKAQALEMYAQESRKRKLIHNKLLELQGNIRVLCRVRPMLAMEMAGGEGGGGKDVTEYPSPEDLVITREDRGGKNKMAFEFDRVFAPGSTQGEVFEAVAPIVTSVLDGYSACIFAYGQTGSGKTHTMDGPPEDRGVNFRALEEVFRLREERKGEMRYTLSLSMLEVYNETIRDLLAGGGRAKGEGREASWTFGWGRMVAMNHSIVSVRVRGESLQGDRSLATVSKLHLIDLAGSERLSKTDATGDRLKEAQNINKSLSALGDVINALGSKNKAHVPFRNSKLTFLLQDSLGGNSKVLMFVNISPASYNVSETVCSLQFAGRCRAVALGVAKKGVVGSGPGGGEGGEGEVGRRKGEGEQLTVDLRSARGGEGGEELGGEGGREQRRVKTPPPPASVASGRVSPPPRRSSLGNASSR
ncbi:kinesin motor family protein [Nannochloropsis oceanica]